MIFVFMEWTFLWVTHIKESLKVTGGLKEQIEGHMQQQREAFKKLS